MSLALTRLVFSNSSSVKFFKRVFGIAFNSIVNKQLEAFAFRHRRYVHHINDGSHLVLPQFDASNSYMSLSWAIFVCLPVSLSLLQNLAHLPPCSNGFDYQSVCHCSKTIKGVERGRNGLITSQFVTAPKHTPATRERFLRLITSQFVTAPKLFFRR